MRTYLKLLIFGLILISGLLGASTSTSAYMMYGYGYYPASMGMYGSSFGSFNGYGAYSPSYGYAGPYSYQFVPGSFWGHYYNPGLYYSTLDYSLKNNLLAFDQKNLGMTYGFISSNSRYN